MEEEYIVHGNVGATSAAFVQNESNAVAMV
jgi:hypothetical protein